MRFLVLFFLTLFLFFSCKKDAPIKSEISKATFYNHYPTSIKGTFQQWGFLNNSELLFITLNEIYFSSDTARTWKKIGTNLFGTDAQLKIFNENSIYVRGSKGVFKSIDKGITWKLLVDASYQKTTFVADKIGFYVSSDSEVKKTVDDGVTWTTIYENPIVAINDSINDRKIKILHFYAYDENNLFINGIEKYNYLTSATPGMDGFAEYLSKDGGLTWILFGKTIEYEYDISYYFYTPKNGRRYINGALFLTNDGGYSYTRFTDQMNCYESVSMCSKLTGVRSTICMKSDGSTPPISITTDGANTFKSVTPHPSSEIKTDYHIGGYLVLTNGELVTLTKDKNNYEYEILLLKK